MPPPASISAAVASSTVVVKARIAEVKRSRLIRETPSGDEAPDPGVTIAGIVLEDITILHGAVPADRDIVVEWISPNNDRQGLSDVQSSLPEHEAIWFLRRGDDGPGEIEGDIYGLVSLHCLFVETENGVISGIRSEPYRDPTILDEVVGKFATLEELERAIKSS